jgi:3-oxoacyl-[acyl-carrier protein] reductase
VAGLLDGKVAIVAGGGGGGIGAQVSRTLAGAGAAVAVVDIERERAEAVCKEIDAAGGRSAAIAADLRDPASARAIVSTARSTFGRIDALANVAGGMHQHAAWRPLTQWSEEDWDRIVSINLRYVFLLCRAVIPVMIEQGEGGSIVNITSISGVFGAPNHAAYGAAKAGLIHLTKSLCLEYGRYGIRCNAVSPGVVQTAAVASALSEEGRADLGRTIPLRRAGRPDDIAQAVLFFASPLSSYVSGQMLLVDGGVSARFPLGIPGGDPSESDGA